MRLRGFWRYLLPRNSTANPRSFFHSGEMFGMFVRAVRVERGTDAQEKLKSVTEIIAVIAIETIRSIVERELSADADVHAVAVRLPDTELMPFTTPTRSGDNPGRNDLVGSLDRGLNRHSKIKQDSARW
jgi:hypothetical protein